MIMVMIFNFVFFLTFYSNVDEQRSGPNVKYFLFCDYLKKERTFFLLHQCFQLQKTLMIGRLLKY